MNSGKQIIKYWMESCLGKRLTLNPESEAYAGILPAEWQELISQVDIALREARQEGLDFRKQKKLLNEESEFGPFWQRFYLNGGLELPGLAEAFDCTRDDPMWLNQWNEVIRVVLHKPTLRAVSWDDLLIYIRLIGNTEERKIEEFINEIISGLAREIEVQAEQPRWSIAALKGK